MKIGFLSHLDMNLYLFRLPIMQVLVNRGHKVYAICPSGTYSEAFAEHGIEHCAYQIERESLNPLKERRFVENIYRTISPLGLDLLHTFTAKPNIYGTFAAKRANVPVIVNLVEGLGSFYVEETIKNKIVRFIIEKLYQKAFTLSNRVVFVNSDDPQYMVEKGIIEPAKVKIIKSVGIDTHVFAPDNLPKEDVDKLKKELALEGKMIVLMVARAIWHKGVREFYEAADSFDNARVQFILVGDIDRGNLSSVPEEFLKNGRVMWLGHRDDIAALTAMADIYVLPSYREGVPRTLLEAASMGKPIVTTDTVGCKEVVEEGRNGFLVPVRNVEALVERIRLLIEDAGLRETMGQESRRKAVEEFDIERVVEQYLALYGEYYAV